MGGQNPGNIHTALHSCRYIYLDSKASTFPKTLLRPHYKACVGGVSRAIRQIASGPYAGHSGNQFTTKTHSEYSRMLLESKGVSEWGAVKICAPLLNSINTEALLTGEQLSSYGACIAGAIERHPRRGEANGRCLLGLAREIEKARLAAV